MEPLLEILKVDEFIFLIAGYNLLAGFLAIRSGKKSNICSVFT